MLEFFWMSTRSRARELAAAGLADGDATGWFEQLYREAEQGKTVIPWADMQPNPHLLEFWEQDPLPAIGKLALQVGCGLGDDAEQLAAWGFETTAFDISPTAIRECQRRFPQSSVAYVAADLLQPPPDWLGRFDFVFECYTLQVLPTDLRARALRNVTKFVRPGGHLLLIARAREEDEPEGRLPWPLTHDELDVVRDYGLQMISFQDFDDLEDPPVRRFMGLYQR